MFCRRFQVRWNLIRRSTQRAKRPVCLRKKPAKSAMKNTSSSNLLPDKAESTSDTSTAPDATSTPTPGATPAATSTQTLAAADSAAPSPKPSYERRLSRFSIKRVDEDMKLAAMAVRQRRKEAPAEVTVESDKVG